MGASNAGDLEISWQRSIVASARAAEDGAECISGKARPLGSRDNADESSAQPTQASHSADSVPPRITLKRPLSESIPCSLPTGSRASHATDVLPTPLVKKAKTSLDANLAETNVSNLEITEISDNDEPLNKTNLTVDIKEFFTSKPRLPGQNKCRMQCDLCAYVILFLFCILFLIV